MYRFTESELKKYTAADVLQKGRTRAQHGQVEDTELFDARSDTGERFLGLCAWVRGNFGYYYQPEVYFSIKTGEIRSAYCDCSNTSRVSLCEHCAAMLVDYLEFQDQYMADAVSRGSILPLDLKRKTDAPMRVLLEKADVMQKTMAVGKEAISGQVQLEPTLHIEEEGVSLTLRIGIRKMYVVKDISQLVWRIREGLHYSYGKNLSFLHQIDAFAESSRQLAELLMRHYIGEIPPYGYGERRMRLYHKEIDEIFALTQQSGILIECTDSGTGLWQLTDEPFVRQILLEKCDDGVMITGNAVQRIRTGSYQYFLKDQLVHREKRDGSAEEEPENLIFASGAKGIFLSDDDMGIFAGTIYPMLEKRCQITCDGIELKEYLPEEALFDLYLDLPQDDMVTCDLVAVYTQNGSYQEYHVFAGIEKTAARNEYQELKARSEVLRFCNAYDDKNHLAVMAQDEDGIYTLLTEGISSFRRWADVYISDRLKKISEVRRPQVTVGISLSGDLLNLEMTSEEIPLDELAAVLSKYDRRKKFIRLRDGSFLSTEDENLETLSQVQKGLMLSDRQLADGRAQVPRFRAMFLDAQLKETEDLTIQRSHDFKALIREMDQPAEEGCDLPETLGGILREYQKKGFYWIETLYRNGFGGILADDMGLGKTLQVIAFLAAHYRDNVQRNLQQDLPQNPPQNPHQNPPQNTLQNPQQDPQQELRTLIVTPASLIYNWEDECSRFAPDLPVSVLAGSAAERRRMLLHLPPRVIIITSYDLLKRDAEAFEDLTFEFQILDEAQFIKNAATKAARAVKSVRSVFRLALTGTPVENRLSELWSIFDYLMPGYLYSYQKFRAEIEIPVVMNQDQEALGRVQKMISPFVLRRLKKDVLKDLPDKIERNMSARLIGEQKKLYDAHVQRLTLFLNQQDDEVIDRSKIQILSELTKLRQLCCDPALLFENYSGGSAKLDLCMELVGNAVEGSHKLLIFSQFTSMLSRIGDALEQKKIRYYVLTGSTPKQERIRLVNAFNSDTVPVFLISLKAGGTGLNLTAADIVIHFDPWWNTAAQNQATDRTHRIGQKNIVTVYRLIAKDTIEDNIVKLQERKQQLADQVLSGGSSTGTLTFSKEELMEILTGRI